VAAGNKRAQRRRQARSRRIGVAERREKEKTCGYRKKLCYPTEQRALKAMARIWGHATYGSRMPSRAYYHEICKSWHLSSEEKKGPT
jgi:hypothetical protein